MFIIRSLTRSKRSLSLAKKLMEELVAGDSQDSERFGRPPPDGVRTFTVYHTAISSQP